MADDDEPQIPYRDLLAYLRTRGSPGMDYQSYKRLVERAGVKLRQHPDPKVQLGYYDLLTPRECYLVIREYFRARGARAIRQAEKNTPAEDHPRRGRRKEP